VEVFAAYSDFPFSGTITIFDGTVSNYIYRRPDWDSDADFRSQKKQWVATHANSSGFRNKLLLTGPGRAMSAFCGFSFSASPRETATYECTRYAMIRLVTTLGCSIVPAP
jgi:hypothetical protein